MSKRILTIIILSCFVGIIISVFIFLKKQNQEIINSPYETIPQNASFVLDIKDISILKKTSTFWQDATLFPFFKESSQWISLADSVFSAKDLYKKLQNNSLVISGFSIGKHKYSYLCNIALKTEDELEEATNIFESLAKPYVTKTKKTDQGIVITSIENFKFNTPTLAYAFCNNTLLISTSIITIESAIKSFYEQSNILQIANFNTVRKTAGENVFGNLYVNLEHIPSIANLVANSSKSSSINRSTAIGSWAEFDIIPKQNQISFIGFSTFMPKKDFFSIFTEQKTAALELPNILPANLDSYTAWGFSNTQLLRTNYIKYLKANNKEKLYKNNSKTLQSLFNSKSIIQSFDSLTYGEMGMLTFDKNKYAIIKTESQSNAIETIRRVLKLYCYKHSKSISQLESTIKIDGNKEYTQFTLPTNSIPQTLWGELFSDITASYITFIDNHIVFAQNTQALKSFIQAFEIGNTLSSNLEYKNSKHHILNTYSYIYYSNFQNKVDAYAKDCKANIAAVFTDQKDVFKKYKSFYYQSLIENSLVYNNLALTLIDSTQAKPATVWESFIDTTIITKPKFAELNGSSYIIVQDANSNLYLINAHGKIQWKKNLGETILGEIYIIESKNNKNQIACNTKSSIHIVDILGNYVSNYPIKLESEATTGFTILDYENKKDYRVFVPCANKQLYLYNIQGKKIQDWKMPRSEHIIHTPLQHFVADGKDYLVFADKLNTYIVNRKGESRVKVQSQFEKSIKNPFYLELSGGAHLVTTDNKGNIITIHFNGKVSTIEIKELSDLHYFDYKDITNDGKAEYIFVDKNILTVISKDKSELFTYECKADITAPPAIYKFNNNECKIGIVEGSLSNIYLINKKGELHANFPLRGNSLFSIGILQKNTSIFNLIIGGNKNFLFNYEIK